MPKDQRQTNQPCAKPQPLDDMIPEEDENDYHNAKKVDQQVKNNPTESMWHYQNLK